MNDPDTIACCELSREELEMVAGAGWWDDVVDWVDDNVVDPALEWIEDNSDDFIEWIFETGKQAAHDAVDAYFGSDS